MSLQAFSRDIVPILQLFIGALALTSLGLLWWQIRESTKWNKLQAKFNFLNETALLTERKLIQAAADAGVDLKGHREPLTEDQVDTLWKHGDAYHEMIALLSEYESLCLAVNAGIVDDELAFGAHATRVIRSFRVYQPVVLRLREIHDDEDVLIEYERVAKKWADQDALIRAERDRAAMQARTNTQLKRRA